MDALDGVTVEQLLQRCGRPTDVVENALWTDFLQMDYLAANSITLSEIRELFPSAGEALRVYACFRELARLINEAKMKAISEKISRSFTYFLVFASGQAFKLERPELPDDAEEALAIMTKSVLQALESDFIDGGSTNVRSLMCSLQDFCMQDNNFGEVTLFTTRMFARPRDSPVFRADRLDRDNVVISMSAVSAVSDDHAPTQDQQWQEKPFAVAKISACPMRGDFVRGPPQYIVRVCPCPTDEVLKRIPIPNRTWTDPLITNCTVMMFAATAHAIAAFSMLTKHGFLATCSRSRLSW